MTPAAQATSSPPQSLFLRELRTSLGSVIVPEMEMTMRVAVLHAAGTSRAQIAKQLDVEDLEVRMALHRLKRIALMWREES